MESFSLLFKKYKEPFISFANSYLHDRVAAEDIYTDAMVQYWEKRDELSSDVNVPAYILTIVKNMALNHLRHLHVRDQVEDEIANHRMRELNFRISSLESCEPLELFAWEIREIIRNTLDELPEQTHIIFHKSRIEQQKEQRDFRGIEHQYQNGGISHFQSTETAAYTLKGLSPHYISAINFSLSVNRRPFVLY